MNKYSSIKQLVIDETISMGKLPSLESLTQLIRENFPHSKWQKSHYDWYKSQIKNGKIEIEGFLKNNDTEEVNENLAEFAISLEKDLQTYLSVRLNEIESGLTLVGIEHGTSTGFIDILAKDKSGNFVVIELKAGKAKDSALGQILGYIGALEESEKAHPIRGILIASDFDARVLYGSKALANITLIKYNINFKFDTIR